MGIEPSKTLALRNGRARVTYIARSFLDYRVPVFAALDELLGKRLCVVFSADIVPDRVREKAKAALGERAIPMRGEWKLGGHGRHADSMANTEVGFQYQPGLLRMIQERNPDILISDGFFKWTVGAILHKLRRRTPLVICYERTCHTERNAQWYRVLYRRLAVRFADAMCCSGRLSAKYVQWLGMPADRITMGHMAADTDGLAHQAEALRDEARAAIRQEWDVKGPAFLYVGKLTVRKGVRELLEGWRLFEKACAQGGTLILVGDGGQRPALSTLVSQRQMRRVRFLGAVDYNAVACCYAGADALVMPTLEDNWSLVVPEAMACGLPVLCSKYNGCWPELVHAGDNGWVFDPLDPEDVLRCLENCLKHASDLGSMGERSKVIVREHAPRKAAESIIRACEIALARRH